jgi:hypothetical protein
MEAPWNMTHMIAILSAITAGILFPAGIIVGAAMWRAAYSDAAKEASPFASLCFSRAMEAERQLHEIRGGIGMLPGETLAEWIVRRQIPEATIAIEGEDHGDDYSYEPSVN